MQDKWNTLVSDNIQVSLDLVTSTLRLERYNGINAITKREPRVISIADIKHQAIPMSVIRVLL
jgi:hypothetical protein